MTNESRYHDRQGTRTHYTHTYLWTASQAALEESRRRNAQDPSFGLLAVIAGAMATEAYMNYLGPRVSKTWSSNDEHLSPKDKIKRIAESIGYAIHYQRADYGAFLQLFALRKQLAHGRPTTVEGSWTLDEELRSLVPRLDTDWLKAAKPQESYQLLGLVHDLLSEMARRAGEDFEPFVVLADGESRGRPHLRPG